MYFVGNSFAFASAPTTDRIAPALITCKLPGSRCASYLFIESPIGSHSAFDSSPRSIRSEEHTSELQSLPTRRSSDLHRSSTHHLQTSRIEMRVVLVHRISDRLPLGIRQFSTLHQIGRAHV